MKGDEVMSRHNEWGNTGGSFLIVFVLAMGIALGLCILRGLGIF